MPEMPRLPESDYESETRPSPPELLDLESTRASTPIDETRAMSPVSDRGHVQPSNRPGEYMLSGSRERRPPDRRERRPHEPRRSGFYLPVWSVALMLILVFAVASGVILLVISLGGQAAPESGPRFVIVTAVPTSASGTNQTVLASPTIPLEFNQESQPQSFALEGPTLEPVIVSPTPETIAVGKQVIVIDAEDSGLNVRSGPGLDNQVRFIADNGEAFSVIGGPTQANSLTWWQIQDPLDNSRSGWAAASYLRVIIGDSNGE